MEASEARQPVDISIFKRLNYTSARKLKHSRKKRKKLKGEEKKRYFYALKEV